MHCTSHLGPAPFLWKLTAADVDVCVDVQSEEGKPQWLLVDM